jgi:ankyrin repeat protein
VGGAHFDQPFKKGLTALCNAVAHGCADACERLVHYGARIDIVAPDESTLLHVAVRNGSVDCLRALLAARPALEPRDGADNTPLILAVKMEHLPSAALLLDAGADPRAESREGATTLRAAAARGCDQCLQLLLAFPRLDAACIADGNADGNTALHLAAAHGHVHLHGPAPRRPRRHQRPDQERDTPPMMAAHGGHLACVAAIHVQRKDGCTAAHCAAWRGHTE